MGPPSPSAHEPSLPSSPNVSTDETIVGDEGVRQRPEPAFGRGDEVGRYLLLDPLGRGAMGQVLRAYDPDLDRQVAIKILYEHGGPDARSRLLREAKAMARIHHPHVVTVYDAGTLESSVFIAMEVVDGPSLDRWLATPRSLAEILDVLIGAARGLAAAHAAGVVHRDFKPANVLVGADGRAKVGDFGLAGIEDLKISRDHGNKAPHAVGTPAYMSPEHFAGVGIDARSDQFSFAITLHEALHGTRPFSATTWPQLAVQVATGTMTPPPTARRGGIDGILRRALSVEKAERYPSMEALIAALERARQPVWRRVAVVGSVAVAVGLVIFGRTDDAAEVEQCTPGAERVEAAWSGPSKAALQIGGSDYTEAYARRARADFEQGLDEYAARWSAAHDESCAAVGPRAERGTLPQRHTAECLENRLESLQGLAELAAHEAIDAGRVGDLVDTLPSLEQCTEGGWIPYPADPDTAVRAAELHRTLARIRRIQLMDRGHEVREDARTAVEQARELGEPYLVALALTRQARTLSSTDEAGPLLDEALELAVANGFDWLAADIVNNVMLASKERSWREIGYLVAVARGLVARSGGDDSLLGNLALNEGSVLRVAGRFEEALVRDEQAEASFTRSGNAEGVAAARANRAITLVKLGRLDEAIPQLHTAVRELEESSGASSPKAIQAQQMLVGSLILAGRVREALAAAAKIYERARERYAPGSFTLRRATQTYASAALNAGEPTLVRELMARLRVLPGASERDTVALELLAIETLQIEGRHDAVAREVPAALARLGPASDHAGPAWIQLSLASSLFVLGQREAAAGLLADPLVQRSLEADEEDPELRTTVVFFALLFEASPPPGTTWRALLPSSPGRPVSQRLREVIDAFETAEGPVPTARRIRDALATTFNPRDIHVQVLDAWLATHERGSP